MQNMDQVDSHELNFASYAVHRRLCAEVHYMGPLTMSVTRTYINVAMR